MAIIGISIGLAFVLAMILSAPLAAAIGLPVCSALTASWPCWPSCCCGGWFPAAAAAHARAVHWSAKCCACWSAPLLVLNVSVFFMHGLMTACFVAMPMMLVRDAGMPLASQWELYLPVMLASALVMGGFAAARAERWRHPCG